MQGELLSSMTALFSTLALVLGLFLVALYITMRVRGRGPRKGWVKVLSATDLGGKRMIALVEVVDEVLVLGIGPQQITLLSRVEKPEVLRRLQQGEQPTPAISFLGYLEQLSARGKRGVRATPNEQGKDPIHA